MEPFIDVVIGHGEADTLVAVTRATGVWVWSSLTSKVVAVLATPSSPEIVRFDLHTMAAVFDGRVHLSALSTEEPAAWHPMCCAANVHSLVSSYPFVIALTRDGTMLFVSNVSTGVTQTSTPAVCVSIGGDTATTKHQLSRVAGTTDAKTKHEPAMRTRQRTTACVGDVVVVDQTAQWIAACHNTRHLRLMAISLLSITAKCHPVRVTPLPWSRTHSDKYPCFEGTTCHVVATQKNKGTHVHVLCTAEDAETGERTQLLTTTTGHGRWHKTHVVASETELRSMSPTDDPARICLIQRRGKHAILQTIENMQTLHALAAKGSI